MTLVSCEVFFRPYATDHQNDLKNRSSEKSSHLSKVPQLGDGRARKEPKILNSIFWTPYFNP